MASEPAQQPLILAIDQGTTSSRAIVFDRSGTVRAAAQHEFPQYYPDDGWVEHDAEEIWGSVITTCRQALDDMGGAANIATVGITNQRETTVIWNRKTGVPIHKAIVWQDRRTAAVCDRLKTDGHETVVREKTGLVLDPYFSASKIAWLLDHVDGARALAEAGELAFGTMDTFLIWRLTGGHVHATDATNAARTSLYNIHTSQWDDTLLKLFNVPRSLLPEVRDCAADFGTTVPDLLGTALPIGGVAGDQQAALFGQACFTPGMLKSTYGTGCFVVLNTGEAPIASTNGLLTTIGYQLDGKTTYALEGSIFIAGSVVKWLRDGLGTIKSAGETEGHASALPHNHGVYLVPAFTGLGAPHWRSDARGALVGLTQDVGPEILSRAALESVAYQTRDLFRAMAEDGVQPATLRVDGGMVVNNWLLQFLSDILDIAVERPAVTETTALGAAYLAGLQAGIYKGLDDLSGQWTLEKSFTPAMDEDARQKLLSGWHKAVERVLL